MKLTEAQQQQAVQLLEAWLELKAAGEASYFKNDYKRLVTAALKFTELYASVPRPRSRKKEQVANTQIRAIGKKTGQ